MIFKNIFSRNFLATLALAGVAFCITGCSEKTPEEKLAEAFSMMENQETSRAVLKLTEIAREHPDDPAADEANLILAKYYSGTGNGPKTLEFLNKVYESNEFNSPAAQEALMGLVAINAQLNDFESAETILKGAIEKAEDVATLDASDYQIQLAQLYLSWLDSNEKPAEGETMLQQMMLHHEENTVRGVARETLANYYRVQGLFEESNRIYDEYLEVYPEDSIRSQLEFAKVLNLYQSGKKEEALVQASEVQAQMLNELDTMEGMDKRMNHYRTLAINFQQLEQYDKAEQYFINAMGEKPMSLEALKMQFEIADMYIKATFRNMDEDLFNKGIDVLEQIISENPGTNIAISAEDQITQANTALGRVKEMIAAREAAEAEAAAQAEEGTTEVPVSGEADNDELPQAAPTE